VQLLNIFSLRNIFSRIYEIIKMLLYFSAIPSVEEATRKVSPPLKRKLISLVYDHSSFSASLKQPLEKTRQQLIGFQNVLRILLQPLFEILEYE
jgi:hypothetical protein